MKSAASYDDMWLQWSAAVERFNLERERLYPGTLGPGAAVGPTIDETLLDAAAIDLEREHRRLFGEGHLCPQHYREILRRRPNQQQETRP